MNPKRLRIFNLVDILKKQTDENNPLSTNQLCSLLDNCDRKTIYRDINMLKEAGYEIFDRMVSNEKVYYMLDREFNEAELRILIDCVQASAFIPKKMSDNLIEKIACLAGSKKRDLLKKNTAFFNTKKHSNDEIFKSIEAIEQAINDKKKIAFFYFTLDEHAQRKYKYDKKIYIVEPSALIYNKDKYYIRAYNEENQEMRNYRVDRMSKVEVLDEAVSEKSFISDEELSEYTSSVFGMYSGKTENVILKFKDKLLDVVFDKFGEDANISRLNETTCMVMVKVQISSIFYGWMMQFPDKMEVVSPEHLIKDYKEWREREFEI